MHLPCLHDGPDSPRWLPELRMVVWPSRRVSKNTKSQRLTGGKGSLSTKQVARIGRMQLNPDSWLKPFEKRRLPCCALCNQGTGVAQADLLPHLTGNRMNWEQPYTSAELRASHRPLGVSMVMDGGARG